MSPQKEADADASGADDDDGGPLTPLPASDAEGSDDAPGGYQLVSLRDLETRVCIRACFHSHVCHVLEYCLRIHAHVRWGEEVALLLGCRSVRFFPIRNDATYATRKARQSTPAI